MTPSKITSSACKLYGKTYTGLRHSDCFKKAFADGALFIDKPYIIQGFVDEDGEFLTRKEAFERAVLCGQIEDKGEAPGSRILFSEDIWPLKRD